MAAKAHLLLGRRGSGDIGDAAAVKKKDLYPGIPRARSMPERPWDSIWSEPDRFGGGKHKLA
jgi:hypothetical protein